MMEKERQRMTFNRTILELKWTMLAIESTAKGAFNRTILELKLELPYDANRVQVF